MGEPRSSSPVSDHYSDGMDSLSMRDKSLLKRSVSKHHNNNFKAGYVPVHEQYLHKTGIRGRKTFAFWTLIGLLFTLAVGNLILTSTILGVLRLGKGMQSLELVPEESSIKFFGETDLGHVYKRNGKLEGFRDIPIEIVGENGSILVNLSSSRNSRPVTKLKMRKNETSFAHIAGFDVKNADNKIIFTTDNPRWNLGKKAKHLNTDSVQTNRVVGPKDSKLKIEARSVNLKGAEGTELDGKELIFAADQDVSFKSINGSVVLGAGGGGIFIDTKKIPIAVSKGESHVSAQYKICVCMPQGKLFRIPVPKDSRNKVYCNHFHSQHDPCM